jgi:hypothetical protein
MTKGVGIFTRPCGGCRTSRDGRTIDYRSGEAAIQDSLACRARSLDKKMINTESAFQGRLERGFRSHIESRQRMEWRNGRLALKRAFTAEARDISLTPTRPLESPPGAVRSDRYHP